VQDATEVEARGAIVVEGAAVVEAPDVIEAPAAIVVDTEAWLRSAGLVQVCSAVQDELGVGVGVGVGQDGVGAVAGPAAPEVGPVWFQVGWVSPAARQVWFRVEWVAPVVEPDESQAAPDEFAAGLDGLPRRVSGWVGQGLVEQDEFQAARGGLAGRLADQDVWVV
jgi:hypothetical protein